MIQSKSLHPVLLLAIGVVVMLGAVVGSIFLSSVVHPGYALSLAVVGVLVSAAVVAQIPEPAGAQAAREKKEQEPINWDLISRNIEAVHTCPCTLGDRVRAIEEVHNAVRRELKGLLDDGRRAQLEVEAARRGEQLRQIDALERNRQQTQANNLAKQVVAELADILVKQRKAAETTREAAIAERLAQEAERPSVAAAVAEEADELELVTAEE